jgi:hypothetical protein
VSSLQVLLPLSVLAVPFRLPKPRFPVSAKQSGLLRHDRTVILILLHAILQLTGTGTYRFDCRTKGVAIPTVALNFYTRRCCSHWPRATTNDDQNDLENNTVPYTVYYSTYSYVHRTYRYYNVVTSRRAVQQNPAI